MSADIVGEGCPQCHQPQLRIWRETGFEYEAAPAPLTLTLTFRCECRSCGWEYQTEHRERLNRGADGRLL